MADQVKYQPSHFGICVTDLERSMRFYCDGLGFEPAERYDLEDWPDSGLDRGLEVQGPVKLVSQFIRSGGMGIELLFFASPTPSGTPSATRGQIGITHLSFYVDDVDVAIGEARRVRRHAAREHALEPGRRPRVPRRPRRHARRADEVAASSPPESQKSGPTASLNSRSAFKRCSTPLHFLPGTRTPVSSGPRFAHGAVTQ